LEEGEMARGKEMNEEFSGGARSRGREARVSGICGTEGWEASSEP
jgi:hypothetical protein